MPFPDNPAQPVPGEPTKAQMIGMAALMLGSAEVAELNREERATLFAGYLIGAWRQGYRAGVQTGAQPT